jgi:hypothetical protein
MQDLNTRSSSGFMEVGTDYMGWLCGSKATGYWFQQTNEQSLG